MAIAFFVKLWLTSATRIIPWYGPEDQSNFLEHAKYIAGGLWFGPYDSLTLIKQPFFPMFLAGLQEFGIPLPIAHLVVYAFACYVACIAVKPLVRNTLLLCAMFVVLYFNPMENSFVGSWAADRVQVNGALALLAISCAAALFIRRQATFRRTLPWAIGLGVSVCALWLNREEAPWIVLPLAVLFVAYLYPVLRERRWPALGWRVASIAVVLGLFWTAIGTIMLVNGSIYGWYTTSENSSIELVSAYNSLARIDPRVPTDRRFPVPHAARLIAYSVSPAARELASYLEGAPGVSWQQYGCELFHACGDIHGGWFIWAFRYAVSVTGHYKSGRSARAFYLTLAKEIDSACDNGKIVCKPKGRTLLPPLTYADVGTLEMNFAKALTSGVTFNLYTNDLDPNCCALGDAKLREDYDFIVRSVDDGIAKEPHAADEPFKRAVLGEIALTYQNVFPYWVALAVLIVLVRVCLIAIGRSQLSRYDYLIPAVSVAVGFASLSFFLALATTLALADIIDVYTGPLYPFIILFVALITAVEAPEYLQAINRRPPAVKA